MESTFSNRKQKKIFYTSIAVAIVLTFNLLRSNLNEENRSWRTTGRSTKGFPSPKVLGLVDILPGDIWTVSGEKNKVV